MYSRILVPLDCSKRAEAILPHVENLVEHYQADVILYGVLEPEPAVLTPDPFYTPLDPHMYQQRVAEVRDYLTDQATRFHRKGIKAKVEVGEGPIVEKIIDIAERENVDLIAMASHGRTGLSGVFYGSVAAGVLHRIDRPLLLIRSLEDDIS